MLITQRVCNKFGKVNNFGYTNLLRGFGHRFPNKVSMYKKV